MNTTATVPREWEQQWREWAAKEPAIDERQLQRNLLDQIVEAGASNPCPSGAGRRGGIGAGCADWVRDDPTTSCSAHRVRSRRLVTRSTGQRHSRSPRGQGTDLCADGIDEGRRRSPDNDSESAVCFGVYRDGGRWLAGGRGCAVGPGDGLTRTGHRSRRNRMPHHCFLAESTRWRKLIEEARTPSTKKSSTESGSSPQRFTILNSRCGRGPDRAPVLPSARVGKTGSGSDHRPQPASRYRVHATAL